MNIPNTLTLLRIAVIPFFIMAYYLPSEFNTILAAGLFVFASLTDWVDGYLARKLNQRTSFGAFLDPVADKLLVTGALIILSVNYNSLLITVLSVIILCREIFISALREWVAKNGDSSTLAVSNLGKWKTAFQMLAITILLTFPHEYFINIVGIALLGVAAFLSLISMVTYIKLAAVDLSSFRRVSI